MRRHLIWIQVNGLPKILHRFLIPRTLVRLDTAVEPASPIVCGRQGEGGKKNCKESQPHGSSIPPRCRQYSRLESSVPGYDFKVVNYGSSGHFEDVRRRVNARF